jgi:hypothetical protein
LFISTDWEEFRGLSSTIERAVKPPYLIIDGRRMIPEPQSLTRKGYRYIAVGSALSEPAPAEAGGENGRAPVAAARAGQPADLSAGRIQLSLEEGARRRSLSCRRRRWPRAGRRRRRLPTIETGAKIVVLDRHSRPSSSGDSSRRSRSSPFPTARRAPIRPFSLILAIPPAIGAVACLLAGLAAAIEGFPRDVTLFVMPWRRWPIASGARRLGLLALRRAAPSGRASPAPVRPAVSTVGVRSSGRARPWRTRSSKRRPGFRARTPTPRRGPARRRR